jgi:hypothetical protein
LLGSQVDIRVFRHALKFDVALLCESSNPVEKGLAEYREDPSECQIILGEGVNRSRQRNRPVLGSRGASLAKIDEKLRAAASRAVKGSPSTHCS